jgi:hypothetical protein
MKSTGMPNKAGEVAAPSVACTADAASSMPASASKRPARGKDLFLRCEASISHSHCFLFADCSSLPALDTRGMVAL